jgi:hypothetical protein
MMNKRFIKLMSVLLIVLLSMSLFPGCYGKFHLVRDIYKWNGEVGNKWVNSLVMWVLFIVPVYQVAGFIDFCILNVIEFWTGKDPLAMQPGEKEIQLVEWEGKDYEITATQNRFDIKQLNSDTKTSLIFNTEQNAWYVQTADGQTVKVAEFSGNTHDILSLIQPDGQVMKVNLKNNNLLM